MTTAFSPFYLTSQGDALYGVYFPAATGVTPRGTLLWLPPFAEEANCARRHMAAAARECQALGFASLLLDPYGTGESDGEFRDATWDLWCRNAIDAARWLRAEQSAPLWLVGVRSGALLASDVVSDVLPAGIVCWQPVSLGRAVLDNFLRMKLAAEWAQAESQKATDILGRLREQLAAGECVEVAGYELSAAMATVLAGRTLSWPVRSCARVACLEFRAHIEEHSGKQHTPAMTRLCDGFTSLGMSVTSSVCEAPAFWMSHESDLTSGLGRETVALLEATQDA